MLSELLVTDVAAKVVKTSETANYLNPNLSESLMEIESIPIKYVKDQEADSSNSILAISRTFSSNL